MLGPPDEESVEEDDIIFIKDREQTPTPIMKKQRGPLSIGGREEKKKPKISMPSSSEKEEDKKDDMEENEVVIAEFAAKTRYSEK